MRKEPEIVNILREEERLKKLQTSTSTCYNHIVLSEEASIDTVIKNISEQKQAEHWFYSIIEYADDLICLMDKHCRYIIVNKKLLSYLGFAPEEVLGKTYNDFHSPIDSQDFSQKITWIFEHGQSLRDEYSKDQKWFLRTISPVKNSITCQTVAVLVISREITENKKAEEELVEKEKKYHTLFRLLPQTILLVDNEGIILNVNEQINEWLGYKPDEIIKTNLFDLPFLTKRSKQIMKKNISTTLLHNRIPAYEIEIHTKKGKKQVGIVNTKPLRDEQNKIVANLLAISDITKRKQLEEKMRIKDNAIDSSINAIILIDLQGNITYANKTFFHMWRYIKEQEVIGKPIEHFWKTQGKYYEAMDVLKITGEWMGELTGIRKDRSTFPVQFSANIIKSKSNKPMRIMGCFVDLTKYKKNIKTINNNKSQEILEESFGMIYDFNVKNGIYDYVSSSSNKILGYNTEEIISYTLKQIEELIHPEDIDRWNQHFKLITNHQHKKGNIHTIEYRIKHKLFGYRWVNDTCSVIFNQQNEPIEIIGTIRDISDQKKTWDDLIKSEEKYRILAETSTDGVFTTDSLGRFTYVNPAFEKLCGRPKNQIISTPFRNYLFEDSIYYFQQIFIDAQKKNEKIENIELELIVDDGSITPIEANIAPLKKEKEFGGIVCTVRDISQRREIQDELKKNERLKTEFMNIAAHELRSPVTPIKGYLDLIIHDSETNEKIKNWAKISLRNADRLLKLVNDILDVARLDSDTMRFNMEKINPVELLKEIVEDMRITITNKKLEFRVNIPTELPYIIGDKNRLSQVLKNLIDNSIKFTDSGFIALDVETNDNHLLIAVEDTGIGVTNDELKKIFTKFYQAYTGEDRNNQGTGLGLFISKEIVKKHKGTIWAESKIGKGSRFIVELPYIHKIMNDV